jgi:hypothetical protein
MPGSKNQGCMLSGVCFKINGSNHPKKKKGLPLSSFFVIGVIF